MVRFDGQVDRQITLSIPFVGPPGKLTIEIVRDTRCDILNLDEVSVKNQLRLLVNLFEKHVMDSHTPATS